MPRGTTDPRVCKKNPARSFYETKLLTTTNGSYSANDVVGGLLQFNVGDVFRNGIVVNASLVDLSNVKSKLYLYLFGEQPTVFADNAAFVPTATDLDSAFGPIEFSSYLTHGTLAFSGVITPAILSYYAPSGTVYGYLVTENTLTYNSTNALRLSLLIWEG